MVVTQLLTSLLCGCAGELRCSLLFQVKESPMCVYILFSHSNTDIVLDSSSLLCGDAGSLNTAW